MTAAAVVVVVVITAAGVVVVVTARSLLSHPFKRYFAKKNDIFCSNEFSFENPASRFTTTFDSIKIYLFPLFQVLNIIL